MADILQSVLIELGLAIAPFKAVKTPDDAIAFFHQLGFDFPVAAFGPGLNALTSQASGLVSAIEALANASSDSDVGNALAALFPKLLATVDAINQLHSELTSNA